MTSQEILKADLLDLLFDNRNKEYGAYTLRKFYTQRLGIALGVALSLMFLFFMLSRMNSSGSAASNNNHEVVVETFELPKVKPKIDPPPPIPPARRTAAPLAQVKLTDMIKITTDPPPIPDQTELLTKAVSNINTSGTYSTGTSVPVTAPAGPATTPDPPPAPKEVLMQREPEFPGGVKAWANFLSRNLRAPDELESGEQKRVIIRFQVAVDGSVTSFEVVQSAGQQYDDEVIRVLRRMPKWLPALVNSQPVSRSFTQPVTFQAE